ncbi:MAG: hypothetical protein DIU80_022600 [Chloroflexota bacterium]|nr:MAG: hypothetical protein DIU80_12130 [Chloroflexota bacterium]
MGNFIRVALALLVTLLFTACSSPSAPSTSSGVRAQPTPPPGKATVVGRVLDSRTGEAMPNTPVRLAEVYRSGEDGAYVLDGASSPGALTNGTGEFVFSNIEAREYVLVVGDLLGDYVVIAEASGLARVWNAESGKVLDVGTLSIDLKGPEQQSGQ